MIPGPKHKDPFDDHTLEIEGFRKRDERWLRFTGRASNPDDVVEIDMSEAQLRDWLIELKAWLLHW